MMAVQGKAVAQGKSAGKPIIIILAGVLCLFFFVVGTLLHIQTSEAFFLPVHSVEFSLNWSILIQPWHLFHGDYSTPYTIAYLWGWVIETLFLGCIAGYDIAHYSIKYYNPKLAETFRIVTLLLLGFDGYTDYLFTSATVGTVGAIAFSLMLCFVVFFFGTVGASYLEKGIRGLRP